LHGDIRGGVGPSCFEGVPGIAALYARHPGAQIVVTRENFGCGSSREMAVWALQQRGFRAVIAPSFARIFEENAYNSGLVPAVVPADTIETLLQATHGRIDVSARILEAGGTRVAFTLDPLRTEFLTGGGYLAFLEAQIPAIREWEHGRTERASIASPASIT
jgi:3-isopropylmalate/(R)-2-methylmalate dehydratase small subunit